ncbi:unnamed protein product, partial [Ilex paraguariensis]
HRSEEGTEETPWERVHATDETHVGYMFNPVEVEAEEEDLEPKTPAPPSKPWPSRSAPPSGCYCN